MDPQEVSRLMDRLEYLESRGPETGPLDRVEPLKGNFDQALAAQEPLESRNQAVEAPSHGEELTDKFNQAKSSEEPLEAKDPELTPVQTKELELHDQRQPNQNQSVSSIRPEFFEAKMAQEPIEARNEPEAKEQSEVSRDFKDAAKGDDKSNRQTEGRNSSMVEDEKPEMENKPTEDFTKEQDREDHLKDLSQERIEVSRFEAEKALKEERAEEKEETEIDELRDMAASIQASQNQGPQQGRRM